MEGGSPLRNSATLGSSTLKSAIRSPVFMSYRKVASPITLPPSLSVSGTVLPSWARRTSSVKTSFCLATRPSNSSSVTFALLLLVELSQGQICLRLGQQQRTETPTAVGVAKLLGLHTHLF